LPEKSILRQFSETPHLFYYIVNTRFWGSVFPSQAGIQFVMLDFRLCANDKQSQP